MEPQNHRVLPPSNLFSPSMSEYDLLLAIIYYSTDEKPGNDEAGGVGLKVKKVVSSCYVWNEHIFLNLMLHHLKPMEYIKIWG